MAAEQQVKRSKSCAAELLTGETHIIEAEQRGTGGEAQRVFWREVLF